MSNLYCVHIHLGTGSHGEESHPVLITADPVLAAITALKPEKLGYHYSGECYIAVTEMQVGKVYQKNQSKYVFIHNFYGENWRPNWVCPKFQQQAQKADVAAQV